MVVFIQLFPAPLLLLLLLFLLSTFSPPPSFPPLPSLRPEADCRGIYEWSLVCGVIMWGQWIRGTGDPMCHRRPNLSDGWLGVYPHPGKPRLEHSSHHEATVVRGIYVCAYASWPVWPPGKYGYFLFAGVTVITAEQNRRYVHAVRLVKISTAADPFLCD